MLLLVWCGLALPDRGIILLLHVLFLDQHANATQLCMEHWVVGSETITGKKYFYLLYKDVKSYIHENSWKKGNQIWVLKDHVTQVDYVTAMQGLYDILSWFYQLSISKANCHKKFRPNPDEPDT